MRYVVRTERHDFGGGTGRSLRLKDDQPARAPTLDLDLLHYSRPHLRLACPAARIELDKLKGCRYDYLASTASLRWVVMNIASHPMSEYQAHTKHIASKVSLKPSTMISMNMEYLSVRRLA